MEKEKKINKKEVDAFFKMLNNWLGTDMFKATTYWNYIEKRNEAYGRGYRAGILAVLQKAEEIFKENYH